MDDDRGALAADEELWWPRPRATKIDQPVLGPIFAAYHAARHRLDAAAREHGLDGTEAMVLHAIQLDAGCAPWGIRRRLGFNRSTLGSILDRLERDGRIVRAPTAYTGQRFELHVNPSSRSTADLARYVINSLEEEIRGYTSPEERRGRSPSPGRARRSIVRIGRIRDASWEPDGQAVRGPRLEHPAYCARSPRAVRFRSPKSDAGPKSKCEFPRRTGSDAPARPHQAAVQA